MIVIEVFCADCRPKKTVPSNRSINLLEINILRCYSNDRAKRRKAFETSAPSVALSSQSNR